MKIIVTGSRGFAGSNLVQHFKKKHHVIGINRNLDKNCNESYAADLSNFSEIDRIFSKVDADLLIHCAAIATPKPTSETLSNIIDTNVKASLNIARSYNGPIINFSSVVVYGMFDNDLPTSEIESTNPISLYGVTKLASENLFNLYSNVIHLRLGNIVGPNLTHGVVIDVCKRLVNEEKFYVFGKSPGTVKPYLHIDDVISFIDILIKNHIKYEKGIIKNNEFNLVNSDKISIDDVANCCMQALNVKKSINWDESKTWAGDNAVINADNFKAKILDWKPSLSSKEAISKAIKENEHIIY